MPAWWKSGRATGVFQHSGRVQRPSLFRGTNTKCPVNASSLYLPESSLACVVAFSTSQDDDPHDLKRGWYLVNPGTWSEGTAGMRGSLPGTRVFSTNTGQQLPWWRDLTCSLVGQEESQVAGWGRAYCSPLNLQNKDLQEYEEWDWEEKILAALTARTLSMSPSLSLQSCPYKENILR